MGGCGKVEIQKRDSHFPTAPISLRRKEKAFHNERNPKPFTQNA